MGMVRARRAYRVNNVNSVSSVSIWLVQYARRRLPCPLRLGAVGERCYTERAGRRLHSAGTQTLCINTRAARGTARSAHKMTRDVHKSRARLYAEITVCPTVYRAPLRLHQIAHLGAPLPFPLPHTPAPTPTPARLRSRPRRAHATPRPPPLKPPAPARALAAPPGCGCRVAARARA